MFCTFSKEDYLSKKDSEIPMSKSQIPKVPYPKSDSKFSNWYLVLVIWNFICQLPTQGTPSTPNS
jgi:hypothetical protein